MGRKNSWKRFFEGNQEQRFWGDMSGWDNRRERRDEEQRKEIKKIKVVIEFKDKYQFRAFSPGGKGRNFKRRLEIVNKGGAEFR